MTLLCPCHSGKLYNACCQPFHLGKELPQTALLLMRSRYSAYAKMLVGYLIQTTHPKNELFKQSKQSKQQIENGIIAFVSSTDFTGLEIVEFVDGENEAWVTFIARLTQNGHDTSFQEKSRFLKVAGRWLYRSAVVE